jgi:hypothetical protein
MCDTLTALSTATRRGAALFGKNSDRERNEAQGLEIAPKRTGEVGRPLTLTHITIPDVAETHACLLSRPFWMWGAEMGANDAGVTIGNEALHATTPAQRRRALTGMDLVRLGLERAATASEAVSVITELLERHGQGGNCGHLGRFYYNNGFIIADPREAYVLETAGRWWAAERVTSRRALSNAYSLDAAAALLDEARDAVSFGRGRCARAQSLLDAAAPRLTPAGFRGILRDHGDAPGWSPANTERRTLCMHAAEGARRSQSVASMVSELGERRQVHWVTGTSAPCVSVFKPAVLDLPLPPIGPPPTDRFDSETLWWRHERLHRRMLRGDFAAALAAIEPERDALEARFQAAIDDALTAGGLDTTIARCWREAAEAEARWLAALPPPAATPGEAAHRRSWARLNQVGGVPTA